MNKTIKFYFSFKDFKKNKEEIIQQLKYEGYNCWLAFRINDVVAVYTYLGE